MLLGSLAYVGVQIRDAKRQMMAAGSQARTDPLIEVFKIRLQPGFIQAELKGREDAQAVLTLEEKHLLNTFLVVFLSFMQNNYYQRTVGTLDEAEAGALDSVPLLIRNKFHLATWTDRLSAGGRSRMSSLDMLMR